MADLLATVRLVGLHDETPKVSFARVGLNFDSDVLAWHIGQRGLRNKELRGRGWFGPIQAVKGAHVDAGQSGSA